MKAVILAAGKGKRLKPLSEYVTKAMMPVANIPITQRLIELIRKEAGINEFIILANKSEQDIVKHIRCICEKGGSFSNLKFQFAYQPEQRGMGHAVKCVRDAIPIYEPFLLAACDSIYPDGEIARFAHHFGTSDLDGMLALMEMPMEAIAKSSSVRIDGGFIKAIVEKPSPEETFSRLSSLPLYFLTPKLLEYLDRIGLSKRGELELQDALQESISGGSKFGFEIFSGRETVTTIRDLVSLNVKYLHTAANASEKVWDDVIVVEPVLAGEKSRIGAGSVIGPNVVIGDSSKIGKNCRVKNAVLFKGSRLSDGVAEENGCWYGEKFFPV